MIASARDLVLVREGPLIPDAFRCFRDLLDYHVRKFQVLYLFTYPRLSS